MISPGRNVRFGQGSRGIGVDASKSTAECAAQKLPTRCFPCRTSPAYDSHGRYTQAEALSSQTLEIMRRVIGPEHDDTLGAMDNLAIAYTGEGKYEQAEALFRRSLRSGIG